MTEQYLVGELSWLVGELEPSAGKLAGVVDRLRWKIEGSSPDRLGALTREALDLSDRVCWLALEDGDTAGFRRGALAGAALWEFAASANLLPVT